MHTTAILKNETPNRRLKSLAVLNPIQQLLATSIVALLAISATPASHAQAIKNGGFESGDLSNWDTTVVFDGGVTTAEAYGGSYSLELDAVDIVFQRVTSLKRFTSLTFMAKAADELTGIAIATVYHPGGSLDTISFGAMLSADDWTAIELPLDSTKPVIKVLFGLGESTPIFLDHIALVGP